MPKDCRFRTCDGVCDKAATAHDFAQNYAGNEREFARDHVQNFEDAMPREAQSMSIACRYRHRHRCKHRHSLNHTHIGQQQSTDEGGESARAEREEQARNPPSRARYRRPETSGPQVRIGRYAERAVMEGMLLCKQLLDHAHICIRAAPEQTVELARISVVFVQL